MSEKMRLKNWPKMRNGGKKLGILVFTIISNIIFNVKLIADMADFRGVNFFLNNLMSIMYRLDKCGRGTFFTQYFSIHVRNAHGKTEVKF